MAFRTHLFNVGAVLVGKATGEIIKDKIKFSVGPIEVDGRLFVGTASILASEYLPQVRMNPALKGALDIIGALNLGEWIYDQIMNIVAPQPAPAPAPTPPVEAQAGLPAVVVATSPAEAVGRIV